MELPEIIIGLERQRALHLERADALTRAIEALQRIDGNGTAPSSAAPTPHLSRVPVTRTPAAKPKDKTTSIGPRVKDPLQRATGERGPDKATRKGLGGGVSKISRMLAALEQLGGTGTAAAIAAAAGTNPRRTGIALAQCAQRGSHVRALGDGRYALLSARNGAAKALKPPVTPKATKPLPASRTVSASNLGKDTTIQRIVAALREGCEGTLEALQKRLDVTYATVQSAIAKYGAAAGVQRVGRGRYGLAGKSTAAAPAASNGKAPTAKPAPPVLRAHDAPATSKGLELNGHVLFQHGGMERCSRCLEQRPIIERKEFRGFACES